MGESVLNDVVAACVLIDDIVRRNRADIHDMPGGAGLFALSGAALFSANTVLTTGVGEDFGALLGGWMVRNGLSDSGLRVAVERTPRNLIFYREENKRTEVPIFGVEHFAACEPTAEDVAAQLPRARSLYIFRDTDAVFWSGVKAACAQNRPTIMWELSLDACNSESRADVEKLAGFVDAISLNQIETQQLLSETSEEKLVEGLRGLGAKIIFLRLGPQGSMTITPSAVQFIPGLPVTPADVTGGGNAYSGAAMVGLAQGLSPQICAAMGTAAATITITRSGAFDARNPKILAEAQSMFRCALSKIEVGEMC